jgi:hypothetical protein
MRGTLPYRHAWYYVFPWINSNGHFRHETWRYIWQKIANINKFSPSNTSAFLVLYSTNLNLSTFLIFILGMMAPGKFMVGFVFAGEMFSEKYRSTIGSIILFSDSATMIFLPLYFRLISKNWLYFQLFYLILSIFSTLALFWMPESPKYLLGKGDIEKARASFEKIA